MTQIIAAQPAPGGPDSQYPPLGWQTRLIYTGQLITPLYGGGVTAGEVDHLMPLRAKALRGQLRFWWRLLASQRGFQGIDSAPVQLSSTALFEAERERWGGMSSGRDSFPSHVRVQVVPNNPEAWKPVPFEYPEGRGKYQTRNCFRGLEYALFSAKHEQDRDPLSLVPPSEDTRFQVILDFRRNCPASFPEELELTMRWWASFGGFGARTRRGIGAVRLTGLVRATETVATETAAVPLLTDDHVDRAGCTLHKPYPLVAYPDALAALQFAIDRLRLFRQGDGIGRRTKRHRSFWPEPDSIRQLAGTHLEVPANPPRGPKDHRPCHLARGYYPRAAFGLPIVFKFKHDRAGCQWADEKYRKQMERYQQGRGDRPDMPDSYDATEYDPDRATLEPAGESSRMASPIILRAMCIETGAEGQDQYCPVALLLPLPNDFYAKKLELLHKWERQGSPIPVRDLWSSSVAGAIPPLCQKGGGATDPLHAFLYYFEHG